MTVHHHFLSQSILKCCHPNFTKTYWRAIGTLGIAIAYEYDEQLWMTDGFVLVVRLLMSSMRALYSYPQDRTADQFSTQNTHDTSHHRQHGQH